MVHAQRKNNSSQKTAERELILTRTFDAPRELVFKAWTEPERAKQWWGPHGFTTPFCKIDLRPGGLFHYCMRSPEGKDFWGKGIYREIREPERLVFIDSFADEKGNTVSATEYGMDDEWPLESLLTVTFVEENGKTKLTLHHGISETLAKKAKCDVGWSESLDRLAAYLKKSQAGENHAKKTRR